MNTHLDIITQVANYDNTLHGMGHGESYNIIASMPISYGVTLFQISIEYEDYTTTTAAISYDYHGVVLAIDQLNPANATPLNMDQFTWTDTRTGQQATMYNHLPRI